MKTKNKEAFLANSVVTQEVIKEYRNNIPALATEVRLMEANPEWRHSIILLRFYKKALEILQRNEAARARVALEHRMMHPTWHPEHGMD